MGAGERGLAVTSICIARLRKALIAHLPDDELDQLLTGRRVHQQTILSALGQRTWLKYEPMVTQ